MADVEFGMLYDFNFPCPSVYVKIHSIYFPRGVRKDLRHLLPSDRHALRSTCPAPLCMARSAASTSLAEYGKIFDIYFPLSVFS